MFLSRNKKNNVCPCKPQFYYIKVGFKGVKIIYACFRDANSLSFMNLSRTQHPCNTSGAPSNDSEKHVHQIRVFAGHSVGIEGSIASSLFATQTEVFRHKADVKIICSILRQIWQGILVSQYVK